MDHLEPRPRRGAHRTRRDLVDALVPSLLAVAAVVALVTALLVWRGEDGGPDQAALTDGGSPRTSASSSPSSSPDDRSPSPSATNESPGQSPTQTATKTERPQTDREVVVLNQTSRSGLAASVADHLREKGFDVVATGNFQGIVPATTVYYPPGLRRDALQVARALPTDPRVGPRFSNLSTSRLTVVVTDSYPDVA